MRFNFNVKFRAYSLVIWLTGLDHVPTLVPVARLLSFGGPNSQYRSLRLEKWNTALVGS
jgi:hypothetical protein